MPKAQHHETVEATYETVQALLQDKISKPRKYVPSTSSAIIERGDGFVIREMAQPLPAALTIKEKIFEVELPEGVDVVFEYLDNPTYTGAFHNVLTRVPGREDQVVLEYRVDWTPRGDTDPIPDDVARQMVRDGVRHLKELAEHPVEVPDWVREFFAALNTLDADVLGGQLTEDCRLRAGNGPEVTGRAMAVQAVALLTQGFATLSHDFVRVSEAGDRTFVDTFLDCATPDGRTFLFPALAELTRRDGAVSSVFLYTDVSPARRGQS